ncbi:hypothetical protein COV53_03740 [Candidatus Gottesmanbacteria bacterium CG11_big_fil_rev_8_21_14_0_20_37_11]|uniref:Uncharacterized protein n=3 Tax=Candidatus Gottesmaniibacteriota TaxID=1752720 RepID=A0A2M7RRN0_9BACT|nr:MAG: hypothetical protein AUJ73_00965 [Candidatus Gottesmanbacteria bacterium CG1_02_37_22]PIP32865.1 MAG: hypothetical protein COX23_02295 [Candidatus Gottesmanbacteria bacterium CG23_combo_of_CG06-09_8_20_14_all_37_19]PIR08324.1 MAG: hypothetical protein COV53_03740 [Candidatus Gottesmanbacteria bacterium CG11_big_fil_rev_8_21_14_0_20_37_11]PIZ02981.1 MAG: hypothetical protein COY59_01765 [Candidatus Gottesmanbacteria bacterium CG_4_10_14_0_8_um_filter_37_24]
MNGVNISIIIGLLFSPMAGLLVFLITYDEYSHHFTDKKIIFKYSLEAGLFAFVVFMIISALIGLFLNWGFN